MIATIEGTLVTTKLRQPEGNQEFKPHQLLNVMQVNNGDVDIVKIKDLDLGRKHKDNISVKLLCRINHWSNGNASGQAVTLMDIL
ncbi:MAG: hypothetical protein V6Z89_15195 [Desulfobacter sp.]